LPELVSADAQEHAVEGGVPPRLVSEHAPLVQAVPQVRRYVLSFILEEPTRPDVRTQAMNVDAAAELWYDDMAALKAAASPQMKAVTDNGALHLGAIKSFITDEVAIIP
jgi:uncharacterized protein (TIGR02118 family)